jgi:hypothetical protein
MEDTIAPSKDEVLTTVGKHVRRLTYLKRKHMSTDASTMPVMHTKAGDDFIAMNKGTSHGSHEKTASQRRAEKAAADARKKNINVGDHEADIHEDDDHPIEDRENDKTDKSEKKPQAQNGVEGLHDEKTKVV